MTLEKVLMLIDELTISSVAYKPETETFHLDIEIDENIMTPELMQAIEQYRVEIAAALLKKQRAGS